MAHYFIFYLCVPFLVIKFSYNGMCLLKKEELFYWTSTKTCLDIKNKKTSFNSRRASFKTGAYANNFITVIVIYQPQWKFLIGEMYHQRKKFVLSNTWMKYLAWQIITLLINRVSTLQAVWRLVASWKQMNKLVNL